jgi:hypothetical protein
LKRRPASVSLFVLAIAGGVSACAGEQSAFDTQGLEADRTLLLTWVMFIGAAAIFVLVLTLTALAIFGSGKWRSRIRSERTVIGLGLIFPVVVLSVLLIAGFSMIVAGPARGADAQGVRILVTGKQWWWRIVYETPGGRFETANELKIPAGRRSSYLASVLAFRPDSHAASACSCVSVLDRSNSRKGSARPDSCGRWRGASGRGSADMMGSCCACLVQSIKVASSMQLSQYTDYALRVLIYAAVRQESRCVTAEVASTFGVSRHHVVKIVNELRHLGYLETTRGRAGGFALARAPVVNRRGDFVRRK